MYFSLTLIRNCVYLILIALPSFGSFAQEENPDEKFKLFDWYTEFNWFDDDLVVLKPIEKYKEITSWNDLTPEQKKITINKAINDMWSERISFDSKGRLNYKENTFCGSSSYRILNNLIIEDDRVFVEYSIQLDDEKKVIDFQKWFTIMEWTDDRILLVNQAESSK